MELRTLSDVLKHFASFHNYQLDAFRLAVWVECIKNCDLTQVKRAFLELAKSFDYFPKTSQVLAWIQDNPIKKPFSEAFKPVYMRDSILEDQYADALSVAASKDKEISREGWRDVQKIRTRLAAHYQTWAKRVA